MTRHAMTRHEWRRVPRDVWSGLALGLPLAAGWDADQDDDEPMGGLHVLAGALEADDEP